VPLVAGARLINVKDTFILFISWEIASGYFTSVDSDFVPEGTGDLSLCQALTILVLGGKWHQLQSLLEARPSGLANDG